MTEQATGHTDSYPARYFVARFEAAAALKAAAEALGPLVTFMSFRFNRDNVWRFAQNYLENWELISDKEPLETQVQTFGRSLLRRAEMGNNSIGVVLHGPELSLLDAVRADADIREEQLAAEAFDQENLD